jgi:diphthine synthase
MTLYLIGIGLNDEKDITVKGLETVKVCDYIYLEGYTSVLQCSISNLEKLYNKKIIIADRKMVEKDFDSILERAKEENVAFLVVGDIFGATTHTDLVLRAKENSINCVFIHNASIVNAVGVIGLELYKYGRITSVPFSDDSFEPETFYTVLKENQKQRNHTLMLLDLRPSEDRFMTVNDAIKSLLKIEDKRKEGVFNSETLCVGCARITGDHTISYGTASELMKKNFGKPPHCLIIPGSLHFIEEEALQQWKTD